jgi:hypothetical protein
MGRGKLSPETERARAIAKAEELFGFTIDLPPETLSDQIREAQSVLYYFETSGKGFKEKPCKFCKKIFAYHWDTDSISYCSIYCAKRSLQEIGLDWNPDRNPSERWGRYVPAVVPPEALQMLKDKSVLPEDSDL